MTHDLPPPTINYRSAPTEPRPHTSARLTVVLASVWLFLFGAALIGSPFRKIFRDFNLEFPAFTRLYLAAGDWWWNRFGWAVGLVVVLVVPMIYARTRRPAAARTPSEEKVRWLIAANCILLALNVVAIVTLVSLFLPMLTLIDGMTTSGGQR